MYTRQQPAALQHFLTYISGGSGGAIYAYIFGWVGCFANFMVLSELASMYVASLVDLQLNSDLTVKQGTYCRRPIPLGCHACPGKAPEVPEFYYR